jgi:hypothetical protein
MFWEKFHNIPTKSMQNFTNLFIKRLLQGLLGQWRSWDHNKTVAAIGRAIWLKNCSKGRRQESVNKDTVIIDIHDTLKPLVLRPVN